MISILKENSKKLLVAAVAFASVISVNEAFADENTGQAIFKTRLHGSFLDSKQKFPRAAINSSSKMNKILDNGIGGEISATYFFNSNFATEIGVGVQGYKYKNLQNIKQAYMANPSAESKTKSKRAFFIPVTATVQFHVDPRMEFSPYIGGGYHYMFSTTSNKAAKLTNSHGPVLQAGFDVLNKDSVGFNIDVKKYFSTAGHVKYNSQIADGGMKTKYRLNPLVVGVGVTFRL